MTIYDEVTKMAFKTGFYLDRDTSGTTHLVHLRLRRHDFQPVGLQVATFNPHTLAQHPGLAQMISDVLQSEWLSEGGQGYGV